MMPISPMFQLMVNSRADFAEIRRWFVETWTDLDIDWKPFCNTGSSQENWVSIHKNELYDASLIATENGWLSYPYMIGVVYRRAVTDPLEIENQVKFARVLIARLKQMGCEVKLVSDPEFKTLFEDVM